ncbi:SAM-dependent methyltransferase [Lunatibacter salilacus]|uniref:SAM-dependent methyltransferase n=1 Tax=Lunatibacter salilacus TaxID=2483804 RepID=UPI00131D618F|nr:SAM-dependent methyltransferase [Lunatibacter salilacus]
MNIPGKLYLIPSVLAEGTAHKVITPQVKDVISHTKYYLVENLRTARRYISSLKLGIEIEKLDLQILDKNTGNQELQQLMKPLFEGKDIGIISEAGCPGIADPGAVAVAFAHQKGIQAVPLSGPSSIFLALMGSGFSGQSFTFHGYLPIDKKELVQSIHSLENASKKDRSTQIFMETPFRNQKMLESLLQNLHPETLLCIAKNITATDEMIQTKRVQDWKRNPPDLHKIPTVFLLSAS